MITPTIFSGYNSGSCSFTGEISEEFNPTENDFAIPSLPKKDHLVDNRVYGREISVVTLYHEKWHVEKVRLNYESIYFTIECLSARARDGIAFPIDPRMVHADIDGANRIYKNATNTGWLFAHAEVDHHHERIITLESVMHTLFEDLVHSNLEDVLKKVVGGNNPSPQLGTELLYNYNSQFGALSNYSNIVEFRKECVKWCSEVEKLLHVGQHIQEDDLSIKHQLVRAIKQAKLIWNADTGKARILATIVSQVDAIIARVEADHEIETRWVKAKRIADEAAKRAAAAKAAAEAESEDTSSDTSE